MSNATLALSLGLAGCASALAMPTPLETTGPNLSIDVAAIAESDLAFARGVGPVGLDQMLSKYDRMQSGAARDALALRIDKVAAQRYATVSRLYWYTDLATARAVATKENKPILALRMLGRLDEDLSCANSRFFRTTLYANEEISRFMKQNFVLYWSSEREVPKVTIDFGDGRKIESTTTGNSAHYVLDAKGEVLDVIPGLYAPRAFRAELDASLAHARTLASTPARDRRAAIGRYHHHKRSKIQTAAAKLNVPSLRGSRVTVEDAIARAQRATMTKGYVEIPQLRQITSAELASIPDDETATWAAFADQLWPPVARVGAPLDFSQVELEISPTVPSMPRVNPAAVFDAQSIALVQRVYGDASKQEREVMLSRLAQHVLADSALNQLRLRDEITRHLEDGTTDFAKVNDFIYAKVFHTPKSDPWVGLRSRLDFTGIPNDGVTMPAPTAQR